MKRALRYMIPILLVICILVSVVWYLLSYDPAFTRDTIMSLARTFDDMGNHKTAAWFYDLAYEQSGGGDDIALELAQHYKEHGNYTKAEFTLLHAIADGATKDLYIALCQIFVEQDKILDAVEMLDNIKDAAVKTELDALRPEAPVLDPGQGFHSQYISVSATSAEGTSLYINYNGEYPSVVTDKYAGPYTLSGGETSIYAVAINENNLVSKLTIGGYTVGGVIELVEFEDEAMEQLTRHVLSFNASRPIYTNDLWTVKDLTVYGEVKTLSDLKYFPYLERLTIPNATGLDLMPLSTLTKLNELSVSQGVVKQEHLDVISTLTGLTRLTLSDCSLSTVSSLKALTELVYLDLDKNTLRNIDPLSGLIKLQELYLSNNALTELDALSGLKDLRIINLSNNSLTSLKPLFGLKDLTSLTADNNGVNALNGINGLTALEKLSLNQNALSDISPLTGCTSIVELSLSNNAITDISAVATLVNLDRLNLSHNLVKELPTFPEGHKLSSLVISYNELTSIDSLSTLSALYSVDIDYNQMISTLDPLLKCKKLILVNCYNTRVTKIPFAENSGVVVNIDPSQIDMD